MYLLELLTVKFGRTYFWRLEDAFCLKPAFLAVLRRVFFANPLKTNMLLRYNTITLFLP